MELIKILIVLSVALVIMVQLAKRSTPPKPETLAKMRKWFLPMIMLTAILAILRYYML